MIQIEMSEPLKYLTDVAKKENLLLDSEAFARLMDENDSLRHIRELFEYPKMKQLPFIDVTKVDPEEDSIYLAGNSLGLMPKGARNTLDQVLQQWADLGVYGHHYGEHPWYICDEELLGSMCRLVGASTDEVAIMNQLTSNLHFLLLSFYRPTESRFKIVFEDKAFPSDHYTFESQVRLHGLNPTDALITLKPRTGEHCLRTDDILEVIRAEGPQISVICLSGVQYYTGQNFDIPRITECGHAVGAYVGWDLAHSVGNVELALHDWDMDFAVWTTYKYLCAGAGNTGGAFLHERFHESQTMPYLTGWWGHSIETRMLMTNEMQPGIGIRRYRMSTPSALHCAALRASLDIFDAVGMHAVRQKSERLTAYFEWLLQQLGGSRQLLEVITPEDITARGAQLSIMCLKAETLAVHALLKSHGVVCDVRKPSVIRVAPSPLYNSFWDVFRAARIICSVLTDIHKTN